MFTENEMRDISRVAELPYAWEKLRNKTVLVSGGTGFIGSHLIAVLEERNKRYGDNIQIISLSRHKQKDRGNVRYVACDICEPIDIGEKIHFIIHLASNTHPVQYAADPIGTITTNVIGCNNLLRVAAQNKVERFLLSSSVEIYGNGTAEPIGEDYCGHIDCNTARAGYNEAKRVSESLCQSYRQQYGVDCVIARLARVFGADKKDDSKAMAQFLKKAQSGEDIVLKSPGKQRFSYCYVIDAVSGILKILLDGRSGEAYNIAADDEGATLGDYAKLIAELAGKRVIFDLSKQQQGASVAQYALLNCDKIKKLGWTPMFSVADGLRLTYKHLTDTE